MRFTSKLRKAFMDGEVLHKNHLHLKMLLQPSRLYLIISGNSIRYRNKIGKVILPTGVNINNKKFKKTQFITHHKVIIQNICLDIKNSLWNIFQAQPESPEDPNLEPDLDWSGKTTDAQNLLIYNNEDARRLSNYIKKYYFRQPTFVSTEKRTKRAYLALYEK